VAYSTVDKITSTLSHRQLPQGAPSTTSQRTLRARHETQARAARRLVIFCDPLASAEAELALFLDFPLSPSPFFDCECSDGAGEPADDVSDPLESRKAMLQVHCVVLRRRGVAPRVAVPGGRMDRWCTLKRLFSLPVYAGLAWRFPKTGDRVSRSMNCGSGGVNSNN
jgi:hypothetical protein